MLVEMLSFNNLKARAKDIRQSMLLILIALTFYTPETLTQIIKMAVNELYG